MVTLALTMGDAAGIGPELCVKTASAPEFAGKIRFVIYGKKDILQAAADRWSDGMLPEIRECGDDELTLESLEMTYPATNRATNKGEILFARIDEKKFFEQL